MTAIERSPEENEAAAELARALGNGDAEGVAKWRYKLARAQVNRLSEQLEGAVQALQALVPYLTRPGAPDARAMGRIVHDALNGTGGQSETSPADDAAAREAKLRAALEIIAENTGNLHAVTTLKTVYGNG